MSLRIEHRCIAPIVTIVAGILLTGCARYVEEPPAAPMAEQFSTKKHVAKSTNSCRCKGPPIPARVTRPTVDTSLLARVKVPICAVKGIDRPNGASDEPGASSDPNLVEIARLQLERDCYKEQEAAVRAQLDRLQNAIDSGS